MTLKSKGGDRLLMVCDNSLICARNSITSLELSYTGVFTNIRKLRPTRGFRSAHKWGVSHTRPRRPNIIQPNSWEAVLNDDNVSPFDVKLSPQLTRVPALKANLLNAPEQSDRPTCPRFFSKLAVRASPPIDLKIPSPGRPTGLRHTVEHGSGGITNGAMGDERDIEGRGKPLTATQITLFEGFPTVQSYPRSRTGQTTSHSPSFFWVSRRPTPDNRELDRL